MDLQLFFQPTTVFRDSFKKNSLGDKTLIHTAEEGFPDLDNAQIAIIGVKEDRRAEGNKGCAEAPDVVRNFLYSLFHRNYDVQMADLGNIMPGNEIQDTYYALTDAVGELMKQKIVPVIIGGGQDLTYANYKAYEKTEQVVNLVSVDNKFDLGEADDDLNSSSFLSKIILHQPNFLFNFSNLGFQSYFVDKNAIELMNKLHFDATRLGEVVGSIVDTEPVIRHADFMSFDVSSIRHSEAPGNGNATPNGLYGEQACQLAWYAGLSDKMSSIGFYEANPSLDNRGQTCNLTAQMIWHFIDGFYNRKGELPLTSKKGYRKYQVNLEDEGHELVFYKSKKSDRWWMDVPYPPQKGMKYERHHLVPCSYSDYETATKAEMPDKWWRTYQKLL